MTRAKIPSGGVIVVDSPEPQNQSHTDWKTWLKKEASAWVSDKLINERQAQLILSRYGLVEAESTHTLRQVPMIQALTVIGSVLIGAGVLLLVGANWENMPPIPRLLLLLLATGAAYLGGFWLGREPGHYPGVGNAFILLGSILFGTGIFLVAQSFQITGTGAEEEYARGLLYWFLGILPLAYVLRSRLQLVLALAVGTVWVMVGPMSEHMEWWNRPDLVMLRFMAIGVFLYAVGLIHRDNEAVEGLSPVFASFGVGFLTFSLYMLSFEYIWPHHYSYGYRHTESLSALIPVVWLWIGPILLIALASSIWALMKAGQTAASRSEAGVTIGITLLAAVMTWWVLTPDFAQAIGGYRPGLMVLFNILLLAMEIGFVWLGWEKGMPGLVNWGLAVFVIHMITRYFDLFGEMFGSGLGFIGAGLVLVIGGAALEKQRRKLIQSIMERRA